MGCSVDSKEIGRFIAELRNEKRMTQAALGAKLGVTNKTISRWENGNYMPDIGILSDLSHELGISVNELLAGKRFEVNEFRDKADETLIISLEQLEILRRQKRICNFFTGAGTGILASTLCWPNEIKKIVVCIAAIVMICIGWGLEMHLEENYFKIE